MENVLFFDGNEFMPHSERPSRTKKIVYHYTSPDGFLSMIESNRLWFSDSQFLNDRSEYVYMKQILIEAAAGTAYEGDEEFEALFDQWVIPYWGINGRDIKLPTGKFRRVPVRMSYYLFCTSLNQDSHSMWSYYTKNGHYQGYNIGLSVDALVKSISGIGKRVIYGKVRYDRKAQIQQLHNLIVNLDATYKADLKRGMEAELCAHCFKMDIAEYITDRCLFYKHPAFAHEEEYRFLIKASSASTDGKEEIKYRAGGSGLIIPYLEVEFNSDNPIKSITLAPMMEPEVARHGVRRLLSRNSPAFEMNYDISIHASGIDVRY